MVPDKHGPVWEEAAPAVRPNKPALVLLLAGVSIVGCLPYALYVERLQLPILAGAGLAALIIASLQVRGLTTLATERPTLGEYLLGWLSGLTFTTTASLLTLFLYWALYGLVRLVELTSRVFDQDWNLAPGSWAFWTSLSMLVLLGIGSLIGVANVLPRQLYPNTAGAHSPFYQLLAERTRLIRILGLALFILVALLLLFPPPSKFFAIGLLLLLLYTGALISSRRRSAGSSPDKQRVLKALQKLLTASGYETIASPRTGRSEVDPLLSSVDLFAHSPERSWMIEVKARRPRADPVSWHDASRLKTAAHALEDVLRGQGLSTSISPCLVLAGRRGDESFDRYLQDQPLKVIDLGQAEWIDKVVESSFDDRDLLRTLAADRLAIESVLPYEEPRPSLSSEAQADV